ncbi:MULTISPECIES: MFS transporter [unclassified Novosphingobium]|uniref:MFS transporter n=2 Tax=Novosphingobium TaxID=165696 RepID=UPI0008689575|nr:MULTISPECIES: MFS transporter [unclassified Novosphingobium]MBN9145870.1 MFS transporter [Novosphingobium sp.]MDR6710052.1 ACS family glucarate transporter-like MFS transporter [Novosphingobium sp. 1748]ODU81247.1 MAG: glucarate transporter [Novosphingobium sp. SCN 63-17]OJX95897.1 MAG: MFS transporter [Novosphingobium sp. 63-713]
MMHGPRAQIPTRTRYKIIALIFLVTTLNYADRATFSIAGSAAARELSLTPVATGYVLSAFAWAYALAQIPGGALLDRFGTKRIYTIAIAIWSVLTAAQALVGIVPGVSAVTALFTLRFLVGLAEAPSFPGNARLVAAWFPGAERGTASAIFNSAQYFALVAFAPIMGWMVHAHGWRSVFWMMGVVGVIAALIFAKMIHGPDRHPGVNAAELDLIREGGGQIALESSSGQSLAFNWANIRPLLANRMMLGIYIGQYSINVLTYFFVTWFPIYLVKERGLSITQAGFAAALPAICGFGGGLVGGVISDRILKRSGSLDRARKMPLVLGMVLASSILGCVWLDNQAAVIAVMALAFFGKGVASLGWAVMADVAPKRLAGLSSGVFNMFGNAAGIVTPIVVGYIVGATGSFDLALLFVAAHCVLTILAFTVIVGPIRRLEIAA